MGNWQRSLAGAIESVERRMDHLKQRLGSPSDIVIVPYRSYGSDDRLLVRGRVLSNGAIPRAGVEDSVWRNLLNTYRRIESDEVIGACIRASYDSASVESLSDEEGYFRIWLEGDEVWASGGWVHVAVQLCQPLEKVSATHATNAEVFVPSKGAQFGVISDIDDTVIQTYATEYLRMALLTLLGNARTRLPFPGVASFYRALCNGHDTQNPIFYVSSSPWNLYDLLVDFFELQAVPRGPIFLRDWGISRDELLPTEHAEHKLGVIGELFDFYPHLSFILIGDSGQHDPEIYAEIVRRYRRRVLAVYIRDVSADEKRDGDVLALSSEIREVGSSLILACDTMAMAQHAAEHGWIAPGALDRIAREIEVTEVDAEVIHGVKDDALEI